MERDPVTLEDNAKYVNFNSRAHVERDATLSYVPEMYTAFQLTRSRGARRGWYCLCPAAVYFNSRAHVERDLRIDCAAGETCISTHALTWSATISYTLELLENSISTHALTWSATSALSNTATVRTVFQLTRSRGARLWIGAELFSSQFYFNSRAHVERDRLSSKR